jgi:phosphoglycolate phosphatase-like HAD superfamily hydrolase
MPLRALLLDFDGTFTDVEAEAAPFVGEFRRDVFDLLGRDGSDAWANDAWSKAERAIAEDPGRYGWEQSGAIVAPASADPYIHTTTVAQLVLTEAGVLRDRGTRDAIVQALYHKAYHHTRTAFRPDAAHVLDVLLARALPLFIVTNARTDAVVRKLEQLLGVDRLRAAIDARSLRIFGDARKFVLAAPARSDARFEALPVTTSVDGLERPVHVRRGPYFDAIATILDEASASASELLVCGDIFELDLALPAALGAHVHLVTRPSGPSYERNAIAALGARGAVSLELSRVLDRVEALSRA